MKPLYLHSPPALHVALDGPALRVQAESTAPRLFPLRRVSRVVVSGDVAWDSQALLACADQGITVSFLEADGAPRARLIGKSGKRNELRQRLADFLDRPDWSELYAQWTQAMQRREARLCAWRLRLDLETPNRLIGAVVRARLLRYVEPREIKRIQRWLRGLLYARAGAALRDLGLGAELELFAGLPNDLSSMLMWSLYPELLIWTMRRSARARCRGNAFVPEPRMIVTFCEGQAAALDSRLMGLLNRLHHWLVEPN